MYLESKVYFDGVHEAYNMKLYAYAWVGFGLNTPYQRLFFFCHGWILIYVIINESHVYTHNKNYIWMHVETYSTFKHLKE